MMIQMLSRYDYKDKGKRYERTYYFHDADGERHWACDIYGQCISAPTEYLHANDAERNFRMVAKGKLLNFTYFVEDHLGNRLGTLTRKGVGFRWKILSANDQEIARIVDPASNKEKVLNTLFAALPDGYAVVAGEQLLADIQSQELTPANRTKPKSLVGRLLDKVTFLNKGLTLNVAPAAKGKVDMRLLLAGMTLIQVHDITGVQTG